MDPNFHPVVNGIFLLLGILLIVSAALQFYYGNKKNYALAFICLITSLWFFRRFFWKSWDYFPFLYAILGGSKKVFIAPLVYFHVRMKNTALTTKAALKHLALPIIFYLSFLILFYFFNSYYLTIKYGWHYFINWYVFICFLIYFTWSFRELKQKIKLKVIPKVYKTVYWFLIIYTTTYTLNLFVSNISLGILWYTPEDSDFLRKTVNGSWIYYLNWFIVIPALFIKAIFLIFYGFIEIPFFKSLFYPKNILYNEKVIEGNYEIEVKLEHYFNIEKRFTNKGLTIDQCCKEIGYSKKELNDYLKINEKGSFLNYLNSYRVSEFKLLIQKEENTIYDIKSIAEMAGFKSRATFYRVFKDIEGMTPTQYRNNINKL